MQDLGWKIQWLLMFQIEVLWVSKSFDKAEYANDFIDKREGTTLRMLRWI